MKLSKHFTLGRIFIYVFVLSTLGDIVTTIMATIKHGLEFETNPLHLGGLPMWSIFVVKVVIVFAFVWFIMKWYPKLNIYIRYYFVYSLVILSLLQVAVVVNNIEVFNEPVGEIQPIPLEQRAEAYNENINNLKIMEIITPQPKGFKMPLIVSLLLYTWFVFIVWVSFEKEHNLLGGNKNVGIHR